MAVMLTEPAAAVVMPRTVATPEMVAVKDPASTAFNRLRAAPLETTMEFRSTILPTLRRVTLPRPATSVRS